MATSTLKKFNLIDKAFVISGAQKTSWILPLFLFFLLISLFSLEWFYAPIEKSIGHYLAWTRNIRPEVGQAWELNKEGEEAGKTLGQISDKIQQRRSESASLGEWNQIPELLQKYTAFSISQNRFMNLYSQLPEILKERLFPRMTVFRLLSEEKLYRVYFYMENNNYSIYLVDKANVVLAQSEVEKSFLELWELISNKEAGNLDNNKDFYGRSFDADIFFRSIVPNGSIELYGLETDFLNNLKGKLTRVGVAENFGSLPGIIGFETVQYGQTYVQYTLVPDSVALHLYDEMLTIALFESDGVYENSEGGIE